jgi:hypothetical protein
MSNMGIPAFSFEDYMNEDEVLKNALESIVRFGVIKITKVT